MSDSAGRLVGWNTFGWMLDSSGCLIWLDVSFGWMSDSDGCLNGEMCHTGAEDENVPFLVLKYCVKLEEIQVYIS